MGMFDRWMKEHEAEKEEFLHAFGRIRKNPLSVFGLSIFICYVVLAAFGPFLAPYDPVAQNMPGKLMPPSWSHLCGTDEFGRDVFSRLLYGTRISLTVSIMVIIISVGIGLVVGLVSGYMGGRIDNLFMRIADIFLAFPSMILAMAISAALGRTLYYTMFALSIAGWPSYARLVRSQVLTIKEELYVEAAKSIGASDFRIIFHHVLPNSLAPIIIASSIRLATVVLSLSSLSFLGYGAQPPTPEWGIMISQGRNFIMSEWWIAVFPGVAIFILVLGINLFGDALRDIFDPKFRRN